MSPVVVSPAPNDSFQGLSPLSPLVEGIIAPGVLPTIERCWYEDPSGGITDLSTDMDTRYKEGIEGRFMAPITHLSDSVPEMDCQVSWKQLTNVTGTPSLSYGADIPFAAKYVSVMGSAWVQDYPAGLVHIELGDHVTKGDVVEAFNHMGGEWNQAFSALTQRSKT